MRINFDKEARIKILLLLIVHCLIAVLPLSALTLDETLNRLSSISSNQSVQFRWDPLFKSGVFNMGSHCGAFSAAAREGETGFLLFNNRELFNVALPYYSGANLIFPESFVAALSSTFSRLNENDESRFRVAAIIIDPGHGGTDPGAVGNISVNGRNTRILEKDITLRTSLALRDRLIAAYPDKRILMTRETDTSISLEQRSIMANSVVVRENEAVIFISIHGNASVNSSARGYEVWHITTGRTRSLLTSRPVQRSFQQNYSPDINSILNAMLNEEFTTESILLADSILQGFGQVFGNTLPSRGRRAQDFFVVRNSHMPAVLVELGFVSNQQDALLMTSGEGLQKLTQSLYNGITNFIGIFER